MAAKIKGHTFIFISFLEKNFLSNIIKNLSLWIILSSFFCFFLVKQKFNGIRFKMKKQIIFILLLGLIFWANKTYSDYWSEFALKKNIKRLVSLEVHSQCRFKPNVKGISYFRTQIGPIVDVSKFMDVGISYANREVKEKEEWRTTSILSLHETFSGKFFDIHIVNRNYFDYEDLEFFKYHNLLNIKRPFTIYKTSSYYGHNSTIWRIIPCIEEEIFYDFRENQIDESRFLVGISFEVYRLLDFRIAGMLHSQKGEEWSHRELLVTTVQLTFSEERD